MDPVSLVVKVFEQHVWFDAQEAELSRTKADAKKWWDDIQTDEKGLADAQAKGGSALWLAKWKRWSSNWYAKMVYAVVYLWAMRELKAWIENADEKEEADND